MTTEKETMEMERKMIAMERRIMELEREELMAMKEEQKPYVQPEHEKPITVQKANAEYRAKNAPKQKKKKKEKEKPGFFLTMIAVMAGAFFFIKYILPYALF